jgi:SpoVK/Ycf46/Vps4 family AAA+-type ATPase
LETLVAIQAIRKIPGNVHVAFTTNRAPNLDNRLTKVQNRLMSKAEPFLNELFRIVTGALRLDIDKVRNYTEFLADRLEQAGDAASANRLRRLLQENDHQLRPTSGPMSKAMPVDADSRFQLVERVDLKGLRETPVFLPQEQWDIVNEFLSIAKSHAQFEDQGTAASLSLLMCGPPGTGKSRLARHIAQELGVDLYLARLDGLISSYLGNTSKNIRAIFDFAAKRPCILFLDEFDAIAKLRGDGQELGELKRVVNSFIQNLDTLGSQTIIVAATNHEELLDAAIWRRFTYRLSFSYPSAGLRSQMWAEFPTPLAFGRRLAAILVDLSEGLSGSDIQDACLRLRRRHTASGVPPTLKDAFQVLQNMSIGEGGSRRFLTQLQGKELPEVAAILRAREEKLYSISSIAQMLGVSKATAHRLLSKGSEANA